MSEEEPPSEAELREAEALARALDRGSPTDEPPSDAFATAELLRFGADAGALSGERKEQILEAVLATLPGRPARARSGWRRWLVLGALGAAASAAVVLLDRAPIGSSNDVARLPSPPHSLLQAQMQASAQDLTALETAMAPYRISVYQSLHARYDR